MRSFAATARSRAGGAQKGRGDNPVVCWQEGFAGDWTLIVGQGGTIAKGYTEGRLKWYTLWNKVDLQCGMVAKN